MHLCYKRNGERAACNYRVTVHAHHFLILMTKRQFQMAVSQQEKIEYDR